MPKEGTLSVGRKKTTPKQDTKMFWKVNERLFLGGEVIDQPCQIMLIDQVRCGLKIYIELSNGLYICCFKRGQLQRTGGEKLDNKHKNYFKELKRRTQKLGACWVGEIKTE